MITSGEPGNKLIILLKLQFWPKPDDLLARGFTEATRKPQHIFHLGKQRIYLMIEA